MHYDKFENDKTFYYNYDERAEPYDESILKQHYHNLFEIYFIKKGVCTYFIDNKVYRLEPGDLVLIPDGVIHNTKYPSGGHSRILINCSHRYIPASVREILPSMLYLYRNREIYDGICDIFEKIEYEYNHPDKFTDEALCCYTHSLFFLLVRNLNSRTSAQRGCEYIERAADYIRNNFSDEITLTKIAKMFNVSAEHFSRMFKKETGFGFNKYLTLVRLQKAESLLKSGKKISVTQIADACGFEDSNYFSAKFKKFYGISPKKLQNQ